MIRALLILRIMLLSGIAIATSAAVSAQPRNIDLSFGMDPMVLDLSVPYGGSQHAPITLTNSPGSRAKLTPSTMVKPPTW